jgi:hypothetical protein
LAGVPGLKPAALRVGRRYKRRRDGKGKFDGR